MIPAELLRKIRRLELSTRRVVSNVLSGQYHSTFKGQGMAFREVRQYQPGDDVRNIDWNVTARMNDAYIKVFTEERELLVMLLVDVSASENFGSFEQTKRELGAELAAHIAFSAVANGDHVGLMLFTDRVEKVVPPRKGRSHALRLLSDILRTEPEGRGTSLEAALGYLSRAMKRRAVIFVLSDFLANGYEQSLRLAARRHDVVPVVVTDPFEAEFPATGLVELEDPETGARFTVDTSNRRVREEYARLMESKRVARANLFAKLKLDAVQLHAREPYADSLRRFFEARARRAARA